MAVKSFFYFRQVHPSKYNLAANSLSEPRQMRNVRKVKVNAQVTFVIYLLESVANFSIFAVWFFVHQRNSNLTLTLGVFWFHVILPYTFLMNTSHNKNLVADEGWWNTIRNTLGLSKTSVSTSTQNGSSNSSMNNNTNTKSIPLPKPRVIVKSLTSKLQSFSPVIEKKQESGNDGTRTVFLISSATKYVPIPNQTYANSSRYSSQQPGTSKTHIDKPENGMILDTCYLHKSIDRMTFDSEDEALGAPTKSRRLCIGEEMLNNMKNNVNNEIVYVHYLNQLSVFEEDFKNQKAVSNLFEITHIRDLTCTKNLILNLVGTSLERIEERKKIFQGLEADFREDETYDNFLSLLFDLEESFISS